MLKLKRLDLEDFGVFRNGQQLKLPSQDGVTIIYGDNGRGKTTLLNGFRYALFGKVLSRRLREIALPEVGNRESAHDGTHGFRATLHFDYDGRSYVLTRQYRPRKGATNPESEYDYEEVFFLERDGQILGPDQGKTELQRIMPESISRFFLFDGELLEQYEDLLVSGSDTGRVIRESIERILGLPVLTNARDDANLIHQEAQKLEAKAAQKDQKTQLLANNLTEQIEKRAEHEAAVARLERDLTELRTRKSEQEEQLRRVASTHALLVEREKLDEAIKTIDHQRTKLEEKLKVFLSGAWRGMLGAKIRTAQAKIQCEIEALREQQTRRAVASEMIENMEKALTQEACSACQQTLTESARKRLETTLQQLRDNAAGPDPTERLNELTVHLAALRKVELTDQKTVVEETITKIEDLLIEKNTKQGKLQEITEDVKGIPEAEVRRLYADFAKTASEIILAEQGLDHERSVLQFVNGNIDGLQDQIKKKGSSTSAKERRRCELCKSLHDLFSEGVALYRDQLRDHVEKDASDLFMQLTTEPEYAGLRINDNYGLSILHQDGTLMPVPSSGEEHLVALSLIGALQKNAPLSGPILMDSPFGRLDPRHKPKVVEALPGMADQVVLMVHEDELSPAVARKQLQGKLRAERVLTRRTARHSEIEVRAD